LHISSFSVFTAGINRGQKWNTIYLYLYGILKNAFSA
jgi:hypothetical protein